MLSNKIFRLKIIFTPVWNFSRTSIRKHSYMGTSFSFSSERKIVIDFMIIPSRTKWNAFIKINFTQEERGKLQRGPCGQTSRLLRLSADFNYHHPADVAQSGNKWEVYKQICQTNSGCQFCNCILPWKSSGSLECVYQETGLKSWKERIKIDQVNLKHFNYFLCLWAAQKDIKLGSHLKHITLVKNISQKNLINTF